MHFTLVLWIFLLVNTAVARKPTYDDIISLEKGQVILVPVKRVFAEHERPWYRPAIFLDYIQLVQGATLKTAQFSKTRPRTFEMADCKKFGDFFTKKNYKDANGKDVAFDGYIDLRFSYIPSSTILIRYEKVILDRNEVEKLEGDMDALRDKRILALPKGQVIWVVSSIMYGTTKPAPFSLAIFLGYTQSQYGFTVKIAHLSTNLPASVPSKCRVAFRKYFTQTYMRSDNRQDSMLRGQIDLNFHHVGPESISIADRKVELDPEEVNKLEATMEQFQGTRDKAPSQPLTRPTKKPISSLERGEVIWICLNVLYQEPLTAPCIWGFAMFLEHAQSPNGPIPDRLRIVPFLHKLPYSPPPGYLGLFEVYFPGTMLVDQIGHISRFQGQIDLRFHEVDLRSTRIPPYKMQLGAIGVERLQGTIESKEDKAKKPQTKTGRRSKKHRKQLLGGAANDPNDGAQVAESQSKRMTTKDGQSLIPGLIAN